MNQSQSAGKATKCPKCDGALLIEANAEEGEIITCDECGAELEIVKLNPLTLEDAPPTQEDWGE